MAADAQQTTQSGQQEQQQRRQQQVKQYLDAELAVMTHYTAHMQAGHSQLQGLLPVLQEMSSIALGSLAGSAAGTGQQQQQVQQYLAAHMRAKQYCFDAPSILAALHTMCSIALGPLAQGRGA
jgi:hypothetical protein